MAPEYGATCGIFPVDKETLNYLRLTGRTDEQIALVEAYMRAQGLFHTPEAPEAHYSATLALDLSTVEPSVAGPKRPQDRILLSEAAASFAQVLPSLLGTKDNKAVLRQMVRWEGEGGHASQTGDVTSATAQPAPGTPGRLPIEETCGAGGDADGGCEIGADGGSGDDGAGALWRGPGTVPGPWLDCDCGDYELHEHVEPLCDDCGGAAGEKGGREGFCARRHG